MRILKKALLSGSAFFLVLNLSLTVRADCDAPSNVEPVEIDYVYDGDTVRLRDGRKVRIIGLNTPEVAKKEHPAEPYADQAAERLRQILSDGQSLSLLSGRQSKDRYGRLLAHLFVDEQLVAARLVAEGLAWHIVVSPNERYHSCLRKLEQSARTQKFALWQGPVKRVGVLNRSATGFHLLRGKVTSIRKIRAGALVALDHKLAVIVNESTLADLGGLDRLQKTMGHYAEVRGWLIPKGKNAPSHYLPWSLSVTHKYHLDLKL